MAELAAVGGQVVPLLAGDLAGLAADAHRRVGEEAHRWRAAGAVIEISVMVRVGSRPGGRGRGRRRAASSRTPARRAVPRRVARPARTSQTNALDSWIDTFGSPRERDQVVGGVARVRPAEAPVPGQRDLVDDRGRRSSAAACGRSRARAPRSRRAARQIVIQPPSSIPRSAREHRVDLGEHRRLQLVEPRQPARHAARRVVLGQPEGRRHVRVARVAGRAPSGCRRASSAAPPGSRRASG